MNPVRHATTNVDLGKPVNWNEAKDGPCGSLPVTRDAAAGEWTSYWQPTPAELKALNEGRPVFLRVVGGGHPPVWVGVAGVPQ